MKAVYKYRLIPALKQIINLPVGYQILSVQSIEHEIYLYALVDIDREEKLETMIWILGTGQHLSNVKELDSVQIKFLGTCLLYNGTLAFHVFVEQFKP